MLLGLSRAETWFGPRQGQVASRTALRPSCISKLRSISMAIKRSGPTTVDVNNERLSFEDETMASDFVTCLLHGDFESCSKEFPPESTEYIGDEIDDELSR